MVRLPKAPGIGHNSGDDEESRPEVVSTKSLNQAITKIEKLIDARKAVSDDIKEAKAEAKGKGFDMKTLNEMLKLRAMDSEKRKMAEELRDLYIAALDLI